MNQHDRIMLMSGATLALSLVGIAATHLWWQILVFLALNAFAVYNIIRRARVVRPVALTSRNVVRANPHRPASSAWLARCGTEEQYRTDPRDGNTCLNCQHLPSRHGQPDSGRGARL